MNETRVYRGSYARGILVLMIGLFFPIIALINVEVLNVCGFIVLPPISLITVIVGCALLRMRVIVNEVGISKQPWWWLGGFKSSWENIDAWFVASYRSGTSQQEILWTKLYAGNPPWPLPTILDGEDSFTSRAAVFKMRGEIRPVAVYDSEACRPTFEEFVAHIRAHAKSRKPK